MTGSHPLLSVRGLRVSYGGINAVKGIDLCVNEREMVCLIGANGAGKTSTLKALAGVLAVERDMVRFAGQTTGGMRSHELVRRGLVLVPEGRGIFAQLSVEENLAMGAYIRSDHAGIRADLRRIFDFFPVLQERRRQVAGTLSGGEQQMLAIGRALMSRPRLLLLDEPSMGLAPLIVARIFTILAEIARQGVTLLVVEQNAALALRACNTGYVMENGTVILSGAAQELLRNDRVRQAYLGE
jgi:branched-chain amino acid transport system ATP-binding protein